MTVKVTSCESKIAAENRHKFAAWTASAAASLRNKHHSFKGKEGLDIIEKSELAELSLGWCSLPSAENFDDWHYGRRKRVIEAAHCVLNSSGSTSEKRFFTHGIAAKLINIYLKSLFLASNQEHLSNEVKAKMNVLHPPVDRVLLKGLIDHYSKDRIMEQHCKLWKNVNKPPSQGGIGGWSKLNSKQYEEVIRSFKEVTGDQGLWAIEKFWPGFQT